MLLGLVQGVTEVEPVSSSAHLVLVPWLLRWEPAPHRTTLAAGLHAGSCVGLAWHRRRDLLRGAVRASGRREALGLALTAVPCAVAGALLDDTVEARLGRPRQIALLLAGAGLALWAADRRPERTAGSRTATTAASLAQLAALAPGVSRSASTVTALRLCSVRRADARRQSQLMSLPVTAGAALLTLVRAERATWRALALPLGLGVPTAAVAAAVAAGRGDPDRSFAGSAGYRLALGALITAIARARMGNSPP